MRPSASVIWTAAVVSLVSCSKSDLSSQSPPVDTRKDALSNVPITFKFDNFSNVSLLQINGAAIQSTNRLRLTDSTNDQAGSVFCKQKISLKNDRSFSTYFRFQITDGGGFSGYVPPADGLVFVLQPQSNTAGSSGSGMGYAGIANSLGVEFDTYYNPTLGDPDAKHVGTHTNGNMNSHLQTASNTNSWANGSTYHVWIDYNGLTDVIQVRVAENSSTRPAAAMLSHTLDLSSVFGVDEIYAGFTASTGGAWARHWVDFWYFQNDYDPIDVVNNTYVSTPTSVVLSASPTSNTRSSVITATVRDADTTLRANWPVTFSTSNGTLDIVNATTNASGVAQTTLTYLGGSAVTARVNGVASGGAFGFVDVGLLANPTITASAGAGGSISPTGANVIPYGTNSTFTLTPTTGYHVANVLVDGVSAGAVTSYTFTNVTVNHTLAATFAIDTFTITTSAGAHGTVTPSGAQTVNYGASLGVTLTPATLYEVADVLVDGVSVGAVTSYTFSNVTAAHTLSATFQLIDEPPVLTVSSGTTSWTEEQSPVAVDPTLTLTDSDGPNLTGARVTFSTGYVSTQDRLTFATQGGITGTFDTASGVLTLTGSATAAAYQAALRAVMYQNILSGAPDTRARQLTFTLGATSLANPDNGHYYEFVSAAGITWTAARDAAALRSYYGLQGYLVTVTTAAENAFVASKLSGQGWMGASDANVEWTWRWVTGPEGLEAGGLGRHFFNETSNSGTGCSTGVRGTPVGTNYHNWSTCEPNDAGGEDYAHFLANGAWNDYPNSVGSIAGYVVEYGGMPNDSTLVLSGTKDLQVNALPTYAITATAGANGSVSPSGATLVKQGHNLTITLTPNANHHVDDVLVDSVSAGAVTSYTFSNITAAHTLAASFAINTYAIAASGDANGTVSCPSPINHGSPVTCTLTPSSGYQLATFTDNAVDRLSAVSGGQYVIASVTAAHTLAGTFIKSNGTACTAGGQCGSGNCVDGVCCNSTCTGQCQACALPGLVGTCSPVTGAPVGRAACTSDTTACGGACNGVQTATCTYPTGNSCRSASCTAGTQTLAASCNGTGSCPAAVTSACNPYLCGATACQTSCSVDTNCMNGYYCAAGLCKVKLVQGAACTANNQCGTGQCVDGYCCDGACGDQCEACNVAGHLGSCTPVSGPPHGARAACATDGTACGGSCDGTNASACSYSTASCRAASCSAGTATLAASCDGAGSCPTLQTQTCNPFVCGATACLGNCTSDSNCSAGNWCSAGVCVAKAANGGTCSGDNQCSSNHCVDGYCCNTACAGQCEACDVAALLGTCSPVSGTPHSARTACASDSSVCGGTCDGTDRNACAYPTASTSCRPASCTAGTATVGATCNGSGSCPALQTVTCHPFICGTAACLGNCTADTDCVPGNWCSAGVCVPKATNGGVCSGANQCTSNHCVDGVCCNSACGGQCEACDVATLVGTCSPVTGVPHTTRTACASDGTACGGACNGTDRAGCQYPTASCRAAACGTGTATLPAACDGAGSCPALQTQACAPFVCGTSACLGNCMVDGDCAGGNWCSAGVCVLKKTNGNICSGDNQCGSGQCVDGVCCNSACGGQCEACDVATLVGTCSPVTGAPHSARTACASDGSSCAGSCDGNARNACAYPTAGTQCRPPTCTSGIATMAAGCNGTGGCPSEQTVICHPFICGPTACLGNCLADGDCTAGNWCAAGTCVSKAGNGGTCGGDNQCTSGHCIDGVCCNTTCGSQCQACDVVGHVGTCSPVSGAPHGSRSACAADGSLCSGQCDGSNVAACAYPAVQCRSASCTSATATLEAYCSAGSCPAVQTQACGRFVCGPSACRGDCTADGDCDSGSWCSAGVCAVKKAAAASCGGSNQCSSGQCVDGVCCDSACGGQCEACDVAGKVGTCSPVAGNPHGQRAACTTDQTVCGGTCDGTGRAACAYPAATLECVAASCSSGVETHATTCDGAGRCPAPETKLCGLGTCGETVCLEGCTTDVECGENAFCSAGFCKPKGDSTLWNVRGGAGCSSTGAGALPWVAALVIAGLLRARRKSAGAAALLAVAVTVTQAQAQESVPTASRNFALERYQPQSGLDDILGIQSANVAPAGSWSLLLNVSYANVPLRAVAVDDSGVQRTLAVSQTTTTLSASIGVLDRFELGAALPLIASHNSGADAVHPDLANTSPPFGLGDVRLSGKMRLFSSGPWALGASLPVTLPIGTSQAFMGNGGPTASPAVIGQWRGGRNSSVLLNTGIALRPSQQMLNVNTGSAWTFGAAGKVDLLPQQNLALQLTVAGELSFSGITPEQTPLEALAAVRWLPWKNLAVTLGGGPGLSPGYGTPRFRMLGTVAWVPAEVAERATAQHKGAPQAEDAEALAQNR